MSKKISTAQLLSETTFELLGKCQKKEDLLAGRFDLNQAEFRFLRFCAEGEVLKNSELAKRLNLSPSRLTRIIDGLVQKEYVIREMDPGNRRNLRVSLSKPGAKLVKELNKEFIDIHNEILSSLPKGIGEEIVEKIRTLIGALDIWFAKNKF